MNQPLTLIATITALPGQSAAVTEGLRRLVTASRAEPGCLQYDLHQHQTHPEQFVMIEQWRDAQALNEHRNTSHFQHFTHAFGERVTGIDLLPLQRIA